MKKTVTLVLLICMSVSVFAQYYPGYAYPVPTLVEVSVPGFAVEKREPDRLTPDVMYPVAYVPQVDKQYCFRQCLDVYNSCVRVGGGFDKCRLTFYFPCIEACPVNYAAGPEMAYPADTKSVCVSSCNDAFDRCVRAGGSVTVCSKSVLNPCMQRCNVDFPEMKPQREMPAGLSCREQCTFKLEPCYQSGSSGCDAALKGCIDACPAPVIAPPAVQVPETISYQSQPYVIQLKPTFWQRLKMFFVG